MPRKCNNTKTTKQGAKLSRGLVAAAQTHDVAALAVALLVQGVEGLPPQAGVAGDAGEALHVEHLLHGDAAAAVAQHVVPAAGAAAWGPRRTHKVTLWNTRGKKTARNTAGGAVITFGVKPNIITRTKRWDSPDDTAVLNVVNTGTALLEHMCGLK